MYAHREPDETERILLERNGLNPEQWIVVWDDYEVLEVISKRSHRRRKLKKHQNRISKGRKGCK